MHNKETIKYIASNIWSSWNPLKWSQSMQLAAVSYILSCLVRSSTADLAGDVPLTSEEKGEFFWAQDNEDDSYIFTFRSLKFPPSHYQKLANEIPICLKRLKIFHDHDNYVPDEAIVQHGFIHNFTDLLKHFKLTLLSKADSSAMYPYFAVWKWW